MVRAHAPHSGLLPRGGTSPWDEDAGEASAGHHPRSVCFLLCNRFYSARSHGARPLLPSQSPSSSQPAQIMRSDSSKPCPSPGLQPSRDRGLIPSELPPVPSLCLGSLWLQLQGRPGQHLSGERTLRPQRCASLLVPKPKTLPRGHMRQVSHCHCRVVWALCSPLCSLRPAWAPHSPAEPSALPQQGLILGHGDVGAGG